MANYGKYYIAVRLLLLKQYLEANAGRDRIVKSGELEALLREHDMPVEKKTLYADFAALGDICGLQLDYDPHKKGYRLLNHLALRYRRYSLIRRLPSFLFGDTSSFFSSKTPLKTQK